MEIRFDDMEILTPPPIFFEGEDELPTRLANLSGSNYSIDDMPSLNNSVFDPSSIDSSFEDDYTRNIKCGYFGQF